MKTEMGYNTKMGHAARAAKEYAIARQSGDSAKAAHLAEEIEFFVGKWENEKLVLPATIRVLMEGRP